MKRRHVLALPLVIAIAPSVGLGALPPQAREVRTLICLEPGDWGPCQPRHGGLPPIVGKWHQAIREIRYQLAVNPVCRDEEPGEYVHVSLLDATSEGHWLDGEQGFEAGELRMETGAAMDPNRNDIIRLIARRRGLEFQAHINALWEAKHGMNGCGSSLLDQERAIYGRRSTGLWYIDVRVPLSGKLP